MYNMRMYITDIVGIETQYSVIDSRAYDDFTVTENVWSA